MTFPVIVTVIRDIVLAFTAITTAVVAIISIWKWRDELKGKTEYELARRLIHSLYRVRDAFNSVRSSAIFISEYPEGYREKSENTLEDNYLTTLHVYQNRWNLFATAFQELESEVLEAEVIWGQDVEILMVEVRSCKHKLQCSIQRYLEHKKSGGIKLDRGAEIEVISIISNCDFPDDDFTIKILTAVSKFELYIKPHLKR